MANEVISRVKKKNLPDLLQAISPIGIRLCRGGRRRFHLIGGDIVVAESLHNAGERARGRGGGDKDAQSEAGNRNTVQNCAGILATANKNRGRELDLLYIATEV